jgi:hypothetical protein
MNDGGSASYYELPANARELQDLIEYRDMNFAVGNIFKAAYRLNATETHSNYARDLRKIIWFAERELKRHQREEEERMTHYADMLSAEPWNA